MSDELVARLLSHDDGLMTEAAVKIAALNGERAAINEMHDGLDGSLIKEKLENGRLRAENEKLRALLDRRDQFIVENGLWSEFTKQVDKLTRAAATALKETVDD